MPSTAITLLALSRRSESPLSRANGQQSGPFGPGNILGAIVMPPGHDGRGGLGENPGDPWACDPVLIRHRSAKGTTGAGRFPPRPHDVVDQARYWYKTQGRHLRQEVRAFGVRSRGCRPRRTRARWLRQDRGGSPHCCKWPERLPISVPARRCCRPGAGRRPRRLLTLIVHAEPQPLHDHVRVGDPLALRRGVQPPDPPFRELQLPALRHVHSPRGDVVLGTTKSWHLVTSRETS